MSWTFRCAVCVELPFVRQSPAKNNKLALRKGKQKEKKTKQIRESLFWILFPSKKIYRDKNNNWKESSSYDVPAALKGSNFCTQVDIEIICKSCGLRIRWKCHESKWETSARGSVRWKWHGTKQWQLFSVLIINGNEMLYVRLVGEWIKRRRGGKCNQLSWLQMKWNGKERRDR